MQFTPLKNTRIPPKKKKTIRKMKECKSTYSYIVGMKKMNNRLKIPTPDSLSMLLGSLVTIQPSLHPGTIHLLDIDPNVTTGTIDPNSPIGTNGLLPKARWP